MTEDNGRYDLTRRDAIRGVAGAAGLATVGGLGFLGATGGAYAVAGSDTLEPITITSNDGTVEYVAIFGDSVITWGGFDTPAEAFSIDIDVEVSDRKSRTNIHSTGPVDVSLGSDWGNYDESISTEDEGREGTIESGIGLNEDGVHDSSIDWHIIGTDPDGYGLPTDPLSASILEVGQDGNSRTFTVTVYATYTWYSDADGENPIFDETFTTSFEVTVNNEAEGAEGSDGDGEDGADGA